MSDQASTPIKPRAGMLRSSVVTGSMTMMSRVLGLVRDQVLAHVLGAGGAADAFFLAFKIPNFFRRLFSEGAFSQAFVPVPQLFWWLLFSLLWRASPSLSLPLSFQSWLVLP